MDQACGVKESVVCGLAFFNLIKTLPKKFWHLCTLQKLLHQMVIIQLVGEALGELFRNPELLCAHVTKLIRTASLREELDCHSVRLEIAAQGWCLLHQHCGMCHTGIWEEARLWDIETAPRIHPSNKTSCTGDSA